MKKTSSRDLYLRTIYRLSQDMCRVRNLDIAKELGYSKPSVTNAIKKLCANELIFIDKEKGIQLTDRGQTLAMELSVRHNVLAEYFIKLGLNEECANENAHRISNRITEELFELIQSEINR